MTKRRPALHGDSAALQTDRTKLTTSCRRIPASAKARQCYAMNLLWRWICSPLRPPAHAVCTHRIPAPGPLQVLAGVVPRGFRRGIEILNDNGTPLWFLYLKTTSA